MIRKVRTISMFYKSDFYGSRISSSSYIHFDTHSHLERNEVVPGAHSDVYT